MFFAIGLLALVAVVGFALTLRAVAELRDLVIERSNSLADLTAGLAQMLKDQAADHAHENFLQHKITRAYLVEILEKRLLPHLGWTEPEKTEIQKWMKSVWRDEVQNLDCGEVSNAEDAQTNQ